MSEEVQEVQYIRKSDDYGETKERLWKGHRETMERLWRDYGETMERLWRGY